MKRVLITGASGHLGGRTLELMRATYEVYAVVRRRPASPVAGVNYCEADLSEPWSVAVLPERVDGIIHLAQFRDYRNFPSQAMGVFNVNVAATATLLDYGRLAGASNFILASTGGLYRPTEQLIQETTPIDPPNGALSYYFRSKFAAEILAQSYAAAMNIVVLRPFFIYGPGQPRDRLIARLVEAVRGGDQIRLDGMDGIRINPVYVDDVAELIAAVIDCSDSRVLNVAGPDAVTIRQIAESAGEMLNRKPVFELAPGEGTSLVADHRLLAGLIGRELTNFQSGLRMTAV